MSNRLASFLYDLMRDHLTPGMVEDLVQESVDIEVAYTFDEPRLGVLQIGNTDAGYTTANGTALAIPTPPAKLGTVVRATDPTYGEGEFIMLKGVASTIVGSVVIWDGSTYQTTLCATTANQARPIAVAMAATTAALFGWYQIGGTAVAAKGTARIQPLVAVSVTTAGLIGNTNSMKQSVLSEHTRNCIGPM